jgi:hypothetical protein
MRPITSDHTPDHEYVSPEDVLKLIEACTWLPVNETSEVKRVLPAMSDKERWDYYSELRKCALLEGTTIPERTI